MTTFRVCTEIKCELADGSSQTLRNYWITLDGADIDDALRHMEAVAFEAVSDSGSDVLNAPLESIASIQAVGHYSIASDRPPLGRSPR